MIVALSYIVEDARWATEFPAAFSGRIQLGHLMHDNGRERTTSGYDIGEQTQQ